MTLSRANVATPNKRLPTTNKAIGSILTDSLAAARMALRPIELHPDSLVPVSPALFSATAWPSRSVAGAGPIVGASSVGLNARGDA